MPSIDVERACDLESGRRNALPNASDRFAQRP
jgi:hypothetical protein